MHQQGALSALVANTRPDGALDARSVGGLHKGASEVLHILAWLLYTGPGGRLLGPLLSASSAWHPKPEATLVQLSVTGIPTNMHKGGLSGQR